MRCTTAAMCVILFSLLLGCIGSGGAPATDNAGELENFKGEANSDVLEEIAGSDIEIDESLIAEPETNTSELDEMVSEAENIENRLDIVLEEPGINLSEFE